jgi:hypothetical protein
MPILLPRPETLAAGPLNSKLTNVLITERNQLDGADPPLRPGDVAQVDRYERGAVRFRAAGTGLGRQMLLQAGQEAIARGCRGAWLDTTAFRRADSTSVWVTPYLESWTTTHGVRNVFFGTKSWSHRTTPKLEKPAQSAHVSRPEDQPGPVFARACRLRPSGKSSAHWGAPVAISTLSRRQPVTPSRH